MKHYTYSPAILQLIAWIPIRLLLRVGRFRVEGIEYITDAAYQSYVFAANHISELDPIALRAALPWSARHTLFYVARAKDNYGWEGWRKFIYSNIFFKSWGAYPAYRGTGNYGAALTHHIDIASDNRHVCIFPEGKKNHKKESIAHGGVTYLAHATNKQIVPVQILGTEKFSLWKLFTRKVTITVRFGTPKTATHFIGRAPVDSDDYKHGALNVMKEIWHTHENYTTHTLRTA